MASFVVGDEGVLLCPVSLSLLRAGLRVIIFFNLGLAGNVAIAEVGRYI